MKILASVRLELMDSQFSEYYFSDRLEMYIKLKEQGRWTHTEIQRTLVRKDGYKSHRVYLEAVLNIANNTEKLRKVAENMVKSYFLNKWSAESKENQMRNARKAINNVRFDIEVEIKQDQ